MGREEKRERERAIHHLERRLGRKPTDEEIDKALAELHETRRKSTGRRYGALPTNGKSRRPG
jgi:DNA-directed RNA polymerase specialized sigma subunit